MQDVNLTSGNVPQQLGRLPNYLAPRASNYFPEIFTLKDTILRACSNLPQRENRGSQYNAIILRQDLTMREQIQGLESLHDKKFPGSKGACNRDRKCIVGLAPWSTTL